LGRRGQASLTEGKVYKGQRGKQTNNFHIGIFFLPTAIPWEASEINTFQGNQNQVNT
jgi:hypothetical protein